MSYYLLINEKESRKLPFMEIFFILSDMVLQHILLMLWKQQYAYTSLIQ